MKTDDILEMLDWNNSPEVQAKGIILGNNKDILDFIQPCTEKFNKNVWDNCAIIISRKTDDELLPYSQLLLEWLADMTWPGAWQIYDRLKSLNGNAEFDDAVEKSKEQAIKQSDEEWLHNLQLLKLGE